MKTNNRTISKIYIALVLLITYLPVLAVIAYSFNESKITAVWSGFSTRWYRSLFHNRGLIEALGNSLILAASSSLIAAVMGTLSAIVIQNSTSRLKKTVKTIIILPLIIPEIILGMVFMAFYNFMNLPAGFVTLIIAHSTFCIPYVLMVVSSRLVGMDRSLVESARDLGAGPVRAFFDVTLPLLLPAVGSGSLLAFAMSFDDVIISVFVTGPRVNTLPIKVYTSMKTTITPEINALGTVILLVTVTALLLFFLTAGRRKDK